MENVPRVAPILLKELEDGGCLNRFAHLGLQVHLMNMEDFGVPQRRRRCIAGNFDYDLLAKYGPGHAPTLGSVIKRSEEHTSELQSLMRHSYAVFCLKNTKNNIQ